jgi:hypothetical protein
VTAWIGRTSYREVNKGTGGVVGSEVMPGGIRTLDPTDALATPARLAIAMAVVGAGGPVGTATGQAVTGILIEGRGPGVGWFVPVGCACVALLVALVHRGDAGGDGVRVCTDPLSAGSPEEHPCPGTPRRAPGRRSPTPPGTPRSTRRA